MKDIDQKLRKNAVEWQRIQRADRIFFTIFGSLLIIMITITAALIFNYAYDMGWIFAPEGNACSMNIKSRCA